MDRIELKTNILVDICIWSLFFYISNLYFTGNVKLVNILYVVFSIWFVLVFIRIRKTKGTFYKNKFILILWYLFSIIAVVSSSINGENKFETMLFLTVIPLSFFYFLKDYMYLKEIVLKSILVSSFMLIINSFGILNILNVNISIRTNSMGLFLITLSVYVFYKYYYNSIYIFLLVINLILISLTMSRTALAAFIIMFIVTSFMKMRSNLKKLILVLFCSIFLATLLALIFIVLKDAILNIEIIQKFIYYSDSNDVLNGRDLMWRYIWENINLTGHSLDELYSIFKLSPHSNYLGILYRYGIVNAVIFIIINVKLLIDFYKEQDIFNLLCVTAFLLCSFSEFFFTPLSVVLLYLWYIALGNKIYVKNVEDKNAINSNCNL